VRPLTAAGILGRASGQGLYRLDDSGRAAANPYATALLQRQRTGPAAQLHARLQARTLIAAAQWLHKDPASTPASIDRAVHRALGLPGPLAHADRTGLAATVQALRTLAVTYGPRFKPPAELVRRANAQECFYDGPIPPRLLKQAA
jgi:3-hydroxyacyl-CoA dehydrogenase